MDCLCWARRKWESRGKGEIGARRGDLGAPGSEMAHAMCFGLVQPPAKAFCRKHSGEKLLCQMADILPQIYQTNAKMGKIPDVLGVGWPPALSLRLQASESPQPRFPHLKIVSSQNYLSNKNHLDKLWYC